MLKFLTPISLVAALAAAPLFAQETGTSTESEEPSAAGDLDLGQPVDEALQPGQQYLKEKHGDWDLTCVNLGTDQQDPCSILQILNGPSGTPMAEVSLFRLPEGGQAVAAANVIVPLETLLPEALTISVDGAPGKRYQYSFCDPVGCIARVGLTQADLDAFRKGNSATFSLRPAPAPDQLIELSLSLKGFTAGFNALPEIQGQ